MKGILEESTISFISLPESTLQDPELTLMQSSDTGSAAQEVEFEGCEVRVCVCRCVLLLHVCHSELMGPVSRRANHSAVQTTANQSGLRRHSLTLVSEPAALTHAGVLVLSVSVSVT